MRWNEIIGEEGKIVPGVNTTADVQPGEIQRQGAKMGFNLSADGLPPVWTGLRSSTGAKDTPNKSKGDRRLYGKDGTKPNRRASIKGALDR